MEAVIGKYKINTAQVGLEQEETAQKMWQLSPNPNQGEWNIHFSENLDMPTICEVYDIFGLKIHSQKIENQDNTISIPQLNAGIYIVKIGNQSTKFVKQ